MFSRRVPDLAAVSVLVLALLILVLLILVLLILILVLILVLILIIHRNFLHLTHLRLSATIAYPGF